MDYHNLQMLNLREVFNQVRITPPDKLNQKVVLPLSKSDSNRLALIAALGGIEPKGEFLSNAADTQLLLKALKSSSETIDCADAGTTLRFLCAYFFLKNRATVLTCSEGMKRRPIGPLVEALRSLGGQIEYLEKEGFPPLRIRKTSSLPRFAEVSIDGSLSSQFISALLLIGPFFPEGMELQLNGSLSSKPYIELTLNTLKRAGFTYENFDNQIRLKPGTEQLREMPKAEADWSSAGYWYGIVALSKVGEMVSLPGLSMQSAQGDKVVAAIYEQFGLQTEAQAEGLLVKKKTEALTDSLEIDFKDFPDLCPTVVMTCAGLGVSLKSSGLQTLPIKESHRINALTHLLKSLGLQVETDHLTYMHQSGMANWTGQDLFPVFDDHRMAMALSILGRRAPLQIQKPFVVKKSYPEFWKGLAQAGFTLVFT